MNDTSKASQDKSYAALEAEVGRLREDLASLTSTLRDVVGEEARSATEALREGANRAKSSARGAAERAEASAKEGLDTLQSNVERNPWVAVLIALGLGFIVGAMSRR